MIWCVERTVCDDPKKFAQILIFSKTVNSSAVDFKDEINLKSYTKKQKSIFFDTNFSYLDSHPELRSNSQLFIAVFSYWVFD